MTATNGISVGPMRWHVAERLSFPAEELDRIQLVAVERRTSLIQNWLLHQTEEDLLELLMEDSSRHGFVCAHSSSQGVQEAVIKAGAANTPATVMVLMSSEFAHVRTEATEVWSYFLEHHPDLITGSFKTLLMGGLSRAMVDSDPA